MKQTYQGPLRDLHEKSENGEDMECKNWGGDVRESCDSLLILPVLLDVCLFI